jgi:hypothetical protein
MILEGLMSRVTWSTPPKLTPCSSEMKWWRHRDRGEDARSFPTWWDVHESDFRKWGLALLARHHDRSMEGNSRCLYLKNEVTESTTNMQGMKSFWTRDRNDALWCKTKETVAKNTGHTHVGGTEDGALNSHQGRARVGGRAVGPPNRLPVSRISNWNLAGDGNAITLRDLYGLGSCSTPTAPTTSMISKALLKRLTPIRLLTPIELSSRRTVQLHHQR